MWRRLTSLSRHLPHVSRAGLVKLQLLVCLFKAVTGSSVEFFFFFKDAEMNDYTCIKLNLWSCKTVLEYSGS